MARRWRLVLAVLGVAVLVLAVAGLWSVNWFQPRTTQAAVRETIETGLPLGSTIDQSLAFLDEQGWIDRRTFVPRPNRGAPASSDGFEQQDPDGSTLLAAIPDAYPGIVVSGGIYMKFGFDAEGRLTRYQLTDEYTGP